MDNLSQINGKQNERIAKLEQWCDDMGKKFDHFVGNDFMHFRKMVVRSFMFIGSLVLIGILIPILLYIIQN